MSSGCQKKIGEREKNLIGGIVRTESTPDRTVSDCINVRRFCRL